MLLGVRAPSSCSCSDPAQHNCFLSATKAPSSLRRKRDERLGAAAALARLAAVARLLVGPSRLVDASRKSFFVPSIPPSAAHTGIALPGKGRQRHRSRQMDHQSGSTLSCTPLHTSEQMLLFWRGAFARMFYCLVSFSPTRSVIDVMQINLLYVSSPWTPSLRLVRGCAPVPTGWSRWSC